MADELQEGDGRKDGEGGGDDGGRDGAGGDGGQGGSGDRAFSQADVDRIVQERLARDRKDRPSDDELKQLRDAQKRLADLEAANKSDLEKAQERAAQLERERDEARTAAQEVKLRSAIVAEAARKNAVDPDAVVALLDRSVLDFDKDGTPTNIADAMDELLTTKPYLVGGGTGTRGSADQGARGGAKQLQSTDGMSADEIAKAVEEGRLDAYLKSPNK